MQKIIFLCVAFAIIVLILKNITFIKSHRDSEAHKRAKRGYLSSQRTDRQQSMESLIQANERKNHIIDNLLKAWISADIPIEKLDKFRGFLQTYCTEGGADTLRRQ